MRNARHFNVLLSIVLSVLLIIILIGFLKSHSTKADYTYRIYPADTSINEVYHEYAFTGQISDTNVLKEIQKAYFDDDWSVDSISGEQDNSQLQRKGWLRYPRSLAISYACEQAFNIGNTNLFFEIIHKMQSDIHKINVEKDNWRLMESYFRFPLEAFMRMRESPLPQHAWITTSLVHSVFGDIPKGTHTASNTSRHILESIELFFLMIQVEDFIQVHRSLPDTWEAMGCQTHPINAWGWPIQYKRYGDSWYLWSTGRNRTDILFGETPELYIDFVIWRSSNFVVFPGRAFQRNRFYHEGILTTTNGWMLVRDPILNRLEIKKEPK